MVRQREKERELSLFNCSGFFDGISGERAMSHKVLCCMCALWLKRGRVSHHSRNRVWGKIVEAFSHLECKIHHVSVAFDAGRGRRPFPCLYVMS